MNKRRVTWSVSIAVLMVLLVVVTVASLTTGEISIPLGKIPSVLADKQSMEYSVLTNIRLPRILLGFAVGGALSMTGAILQGVYRNPLVEPYTLGISGGAALGVAISIFFKLHHLGGAFVLPLMGFGGALATIFLVYFLSISKGVISINKMLLIGVMISFISSSAMMFLMSMSDADDVHSIVFWIMGSLDESNTTLVHVVLYASLAGLLVANLYAQPLNALRLGEDKARHLGINSVVSIRVLFVVSSLLTGLCVSVAGIIGFVGLIIPQLVKMVVGGDYRVMLTASFLGGSIFIMGSDIVARTIIAPNELPIGVITGMVGGLVFIGVLSKSGAKIK